LIYMLTDPSNKSKKTKFFGVGIIWVKALLYKSYARRGPLGSGSKGKGARALLDNLGPFLALGSNNKYSNK